MCPNCVARSQIPPDRCPTHPHAPFLDIDGGWCPLCAAEGAYGSDLAEADILILFRIWEAYMTDGSGELPW
jgi:hypothetical protein